MRKRQARITRLPLLLICLYLRQKLYKADRRCTRNIRFTQYRLYFCLSEIYICIAARLKRSRKTCSTIQPRRFAILRIAPAMPKAELSGGTATLDHAFLPAVGSCKTEHLDYCRSYVSKTVLGRYTGSILCIVLDSVLDFLIIDDERNGVE